MEIQSATPYQVKLHRERMDRLQRLKSSAVPDSEISLTHESGINGTQSERLRELRLLEKVEQARATEATRKAALIGAAIEAIESHREVVVVEVNICREPAVLLERFDEIVPIITVRDIQRAVCLRFRISMTELLSPHRTKALIKPRHIAMYLARTMTSRSLPEIGRKFGGRDHTTILNAFDKIKGLIAKGEEVAKEVEHLTDSIYGNAGKQGATA